MVSYTLEPHGVFSIDEIERLGPRYLQSLPQESRGPELAALLQKGGAEATTQVHAILRDLKAYVADSTSNQPTIRSTLCMRQGRTLDVLRNRCRACATVVQQATFQARRVSTAKRADAERAAQQQIDQQKEILLQNLITGSTSSNS